MVRRGTRHNRARRRHSVGGYRLVVAGRARVLSSFSPVARAAVAFRNIEFAAAHQKAAAKFFEDRGISRRVRLVFLVVFHIDTRNPITLGHRQSDSFNAF